MANEVDYNPCKYKGNGQTVDFPFNWKLIEIDELIVKLENIPTGELTVLKRGVDYTTTKNETGGNVTLTTAPTQDFNIVLSRDTSNYQSTGYSTSTGFQGSEIEKSFDKVSCCLQEQDYNIEDFKNSFTSEINQKIDTNKADTDKQISTNKSDTDNKISEFEAEVNSKLTQVNNAVNQLNRLDEVLEECGNYSDNAKSSAKQANEDVETTTQKMNEIQELYNTATTALTSAQETATTAIDNGKTSALTELEESKNNALTNIKAVSTFVTREIGEIVASTLPLIDAGLHLLDGSLIQGGGVYGQFVNYIAKLYKQGGYSLYAYVYIETTDTTTAIHVIYVKDETLNTDTKLFNSDGTTYSGTDFTNTDGVIKYGENACAYTESSNVWINTVNYFYTEKEWQESVEKYGVCGKFVYDSENNSVRLPKISGFVEGTTDINTLSELVQPQSVKILYYIVIATSTKTPVQMDVDKIATDLNGKANVSADNFNATGTTYLSGLGMPSNRYIDLTLGASGTTYTAPANGWFAIYIDNYTKTETIPYLYMYSHIASGLSVSSDLPATTDIIASVPLLKGDTVGIAWGGFSGGTQIFRFFYAEGTPSE